jgi:hypothetical protein
MFRLCLTRSTTASMLLLIRLPRRADSWVDYMQHVNEEVDWSITNANGQWLKADAIWCEMAVLEIETETSDPEASRPLATINNIDKLNEQAPLFTNLWY